MISKNDIYMKGYSMHEKHRANPKITKREKKKKKKKTEKKTKQQINYKKVER